VPPAIALEVDLAGLLERLRAAGFRVDTRQYLSAAELLLECARRGVALDADLDLLRHHLAPIFCTSPEEQALFAEVVQAWLGGGEAPRPAPKPPLPFATFRRARWTLPAVSALIAAAALAGFAIRRHMDAGTPPPAAHEAKKTPAQEPTAPTTPAPAPPPKEAPPEPKIRVIKKAEFQPEVPAAAVMPRRHIDWLRALLEALAFGLAVCVVWWLVGLVRRRLVLQRLPAGDRPELATLADDTAVAPLFDAAALRRASTALRRPRAQALLEVDLRGSIHAAARGGGLSLPVYAARRAVPEYVALIERRDAEDHQARLYDEMLTRLKPLGLSVERYFFTGDPRTCFERGAAARARPLGDLLAQQHRAAVLLFMDADRCFDPVSGRLEPWVHLLGASPRRALLTPAPPAHWTEHEAKLAAQGFAVLAAGEQALAVFGEADDDVRSDRLADAPYARPYPRLLARRPALAVDRDPPERAVIERLVRELRGYLGPRGFVWLCACAVYPEIDWALTLHLARPVWATTEGPPLAEDMRPQLAALARLPWFRLGSMPTWLRVTLISQLSHAQERAVRRGLAERLEQLARVTLARRRGAPLAPGLRIGAWVGPLDLSRTAAPGTPLRDAVFLGYMAGARIPAPAVEAPSVLARLFRRVRRLPTESTTLRRAHRTLRQRLVARARAITTHRPALVGAALAGAAGLASLVAFVELNRTTTYTEPHLSVAFTPKSDRVLTFLDEEMQSWDLEGNNHTKMLLPFASRSISASISPDQTYVAAVTSSDETWIGKATGGLGIRLLPGRFEAFSPDSHYVVTFSGRVANLFEIANEKIHSTLVSSNDLRAAQFAGTDILVMLIGNRRSGSVASVPGFESRKTFRIGDPQGAPDRAVDIDPHAEYIVTASAASRVEVWPPDTDGKTTTRRASFDGASGPTEVSSVAISADGLVLIAGGPVPYRVVLWDALASGMVVDVANGVRPLAGSFSADGQIVEVHDDHRVTLYSVKRPEKPKPQSTITRSALGGLDTLLGRPADVPLPTYDLRSCKELPPVYFDKDRVRIASQSLAVLKHNAHCIATHPEWTVVQLIGYTDSPGKDPYNIGASELFGEAVQERLVKAGIARERLQAVPHGFANSACTTEACRALDRRVEFEIAKTGAPVPQPARETSQAVVDKTCPNCATTGRCTLIDGQCNAWTDQECRQARTCKRDGQCTAVQGACVARSDSDCQQAENCKAGLRCLMYGGLCIFSSVKEDRDACGYQCPSSGKCTHVSPDAFGYGEICVATSDSDCRKSDDCKRIGTCAARDGKCQAVLDSDCRDTVLCQRDARCTARDGMCQVA